MYKKIFCSLAIFVFLLPNLALAQVGNEAILAESEIEAESKSRVEPIITSLDTVRVGKKIIFDATQSVINSTSTEPVIFHFEFGDGFWENGEEVVHQYEKTGTYTVLMEARQGEFSITTEKQILVYDRKVLMITDKSTEEELNLINQQANENAVALKILSSRNEDGFLSEANLAKALTEESDFAKDADAFVFYTDSALGIQGFTQYFRELSVAEQKIIQSKYFTAITDSNIDVAANFVYQSFELIKPEFILLTRQEALAPVLASKDYSEVINELDGRGIEFQVIDERGKKPFYWFLSHVVSSFVSRGVSSNTIYLILIIPFLAFITIFFRQVIGLSTFGVYAPVMISAAFYILGLKLGFLTFFFVVSTGYLVKYIFNKADLLYLPKVALNLSFISLSFLIVVWLFLLLDTPLSLSLAIFPMLVMSTVSEKFMAAQSEEGFKGALYGVAETLIVVLVSYYLITWVAFNNWIMSWPELIFVPFVLNFLLGKFAGLRLSEYIRFRSLFGEHNE